VSDLARIILVDTKRERKGEERGREGERERETKCQRWLGNGCHL